MLFKDLLENIFFIVETDIVERKRKNYDLKVRVYQKRESGTIGMNSQRIEYNAISTAKGEFVAFKEDLEVVPLDLFIFS